MKRWWLALALAALVAPAAEARWMTMPDGVKLDIYDHGNQNWPRQAMLLQDPPMVREWRAGELAGLPMVDDPDALGGKALTLARGTSLSWTPDFPKPSTYRIAVYAKTAPDKNPVRDRTFLTLAVGDAAPILMQVNFRDRYACMAMFAFHVDAPGRRTLTLAVTPDSRADFSLERIRLLDEFGNCAVAAAKTKPVLYTADEIAVIRAHAQTPPAPRRTPAEWTARYEELWAMPPSPYLPIIPENYNLPEINPRTGKKARWDLYPGNAKRTVARDQAKDLNTGDVFPDAQFPDNGFGWISDADREAGRWKNTYYFAAWHTGAGHPYQQTVDSWPNLAARIEDACRGYLETGDPGYGREATVMFAAFARAYPLLLCNALSQTNLYTPTRWTLFLKGGGWGYNAWQNASMAKLAVAYEQLFPFLYPEAPKDLVDFIAGKATTVRTSADLRTLIETCVLQQSADRCIRRQYLSANGGWETYLATYAATQQNADIVRPWLDELWTCCYSSINQGGLPDLITNGQMREGANLIGQANYAKAMAGIGKIAVLLRRLNAADGGQLARFDIADPTQYPKVIAACRFSLGLRVAGGFQTNIGEGYNHPGAAIRGYPDTDDKGLRDAYRLAYDVTGDARCAWYLKALGREGEPDALWARIEKDAAACGDPYLHTVTRQMPGFGLGILESGSDATDLARKAALIMLSSIRVGHAHADALDVELFARGARIVPDLATRYSRITYLTRGHNLVEVDGGNFVNMSAGNPCGTGWIDALDDGGWVRFTQASGRAALQPQVKLYRRAAALIDLPEGAYFVDVLRVRGGRLHTWCFHTQYTKDYKSDFAPTAANAAMKTYLESIENMKATAFGTAPAVLTSDYACNAGLAPNVAGPVRVRSRLFGAAGLPVAVGEVGEADKLYAKGHAVKFLFVRREGADLSSHWLHLIEPYGDKSIIASAEELPVADTENAAALRVVSAGGRRDLIAYNDTGAALQAGPLKTNARFACASFGTDNSLQGLYLLDGREVSCNGWKLTADHAAYEATVTSIDTASNTVTLDRPWPDATADRAVSVGALPHRTSFDVLAVDGAQVRLEGTARVYQAKVLSVEGRLVTAELQLVLKNCDPDYYVGMAAANGDHSRWWTVTATPRDAKVVAEWQGKPMPTDVRWALDCRIELDHDATMADFPVVDGRPMIYLYNFGPGAKLRQPAAVSLHRRADGKLDVRTNVPFTLTSPDGGTQRVDLATLKDGRGRL